MDELDELESEAEIVKKIFRYYICQNRRQKRGYKKQNVTWDWLERIVVEAALEHILKEEVIEWMADVVMAY